MLPNAEMQVAAGIICGGEVTCPIESQPGLGGGRQIGRAAQQPGYVSGYHIQHFSGGIAPSNSFGIRRINWQVAVPTRWQLTPLHCLQVFRQLGIVLAISDKHLLPALPALFSPSADAITEVLAHPLRNVKLGIFRPTVIALGEPDLLLPQGLAVGPA